MDLASVCPGGYTQVPVRPSSLATEPGTVSIIHLSIQQRNKRSFMENKKTQIISPGDMIQCHQISVFSKARSSEALSWLPPPDMKY